MWVPFKRWKGIFIGVLVALFFTFYLLIFHHMYLIVQAKKEVEKETAEKIIPVQNNASVEFVMESKPKTTEKPKKTDDRNVETASLNDQPIYASFVGKVNQKPGDQWYLAQTKYANFYFYHRAVKMEWVVEEADAMMEYLLSFRGLEWNGKKVHIYFLDKAEELESDPNYDLSGYDGHQMITLSADFADQQKVKSMGNQEVIYKEDPRLILVHELSHFVNKPKYINLEDMWLEEGLAYYLAYHYPYQEVDEKKFPDVKDRKFTDYSFYMDNRYDFRLGIKTLFANDYKNVNKKTKKSLLTFEGIAKSHYRLEEGLEYINKRMIEASIIEFLIDEYGKSRLIILYDQLHTKASSHYKLDEEIYGTYCLKVKEMEQRWREYIGAEELYQQLL